MREYGYTTAKAIPSGSRVELTARSPFWREIREFVPMSARLGYCITDVDGLIWNMPSQSFMAVEHKCQKVMPQPFQTKILHKIDRALVDEKGYRGTFLVVHEHESCVDGWTHIYRMEHWQWSPFTGSNGEPFDFTGNQSLEFIRRKLL